MLRKRLSLSKKSVLSALIAGAFFSMPSVSQATDISWSATAATTAWATATNWDGGSAPADSLLTDRAVFNQTSYTNQPTVGTASINGLVMGSSSAAVTITSTNLSIGGGGIDMSAATANLTLGGAAGNIFTVAAPQTWTVASGRTLTATGAVALGANALSLAGAGNVTLNGVVSGSTANGTTAINVGTGTTLTLGNTGNTFTGDISVDGGNLRSAYVSAASATSFLGGQIGTTYRKINLTNGGTYTNTAAGLFNDNVPSATNVGIIFNIGAGGGKLDTGTGGITIDDGTTGVTTTGSTAQQLQGTGALTKLGTGILTLRNQFNFGGTIDITAGTLRMSGTTGGLGANTAGTTIQSGAAFDTQNFVVTDTDTVTVSGTGLASSPAGVITNSSTGAGGYAGPIVLAAASRIGPQAAGGLTLSSASGITGANNLTITNAAAGGTTITLVNNGGTITNNGGGGGTTTLTTVGALVTGITQSGVSPLTITNALPTTSGFNITNTGTGLYTLTGGIGTGTGNLVFSANNTAGITVTGSIGITGNITNSGTGAGTVALNGVLAATVANVTQNSTTSQLTLGNVTNLYTGPTTVSQGQLNFGGVSSLTASAQPINVGNASTSAILNYTGATGTLAGTHVITTGSAGAELSSTTGVLTIATAPSIGGPLTISGANGITISTAAVVPIAGSATTPITKNGAGTFTLTTSGASTLAISGAVPITINAGTFQQTTTNTAGTANTLGTGTITLNAAAGGTATLGMGFASITNTYSNPIVVNAPASGTSTNNITVSAGATFSGPVTLGAGAGTGIATLKFNNGNNSLFTITNSGAISGTGNIQLNSTGTNAPILLQTGTIAITGSITNVGTATAAASTSTISAPITTTNLTAISQQGTNAFNISSSIALTSTLNSFTSTNTGLWTFSNANTFTGVQPLTFNANSTGGITVSGTNLNNDGTVTNAGTNFGTTTISSALGALVDNVIQNSATSPLVLSGTNSAYTGTYTITNGLMQFSTTAALANYPTTPASVKVAVASGGILGLSYGSAGQFQAADVSALTTGTYGNVTFAATGTSVGLDTTTASATFSNVLANPTGTTSFGLVKLGINTLTLGSANTYTGPTSIRNGTLSVDSLNSVTTPAPSASSSLGAPTTTAEGTISLGFATTTGVLSYTGAGQTTDRVINLAGTTGGGGLDNSGTGTVIYSSPITYTGTGAKALTISGASNTTLGAALAGGGVGSASPLTLVKNGASTLLLGATGGINTNTVTTLTIGGGIVDIGAAGLTISNNGGLVIDNSANATINGTGTLVLSSTTLNGGGDIRPLAGTTLTINAPVSTPTANGSFWTGAAGALELNSAGTLVLTNTNTISGNVVWSTANGTISVGNIGTNLGGALGLAFATAGTKLLYTGTTNETSAIPIIQSATAATSFTFDQSGTAALNLSGAWTNAAAAKTVTLQGSTAGTGTISSIITENSTANTTAITKAGTGTWSLTAANAYSGATTVNGGKLILSTGSSANTGIVINSGGTLAPLASYTVGNTTVTTAGGRLTLNAGGTLDLADGTIGTLSLVQGSAFVGNAATFAGGTIKFDIGTSVGVNDIIDVKLNNVTGTGLATSSGSNAIVLNPIGGSLALGDYPLITAAGTLNNSHFYLASNTINVGGTPYSLSLNLVGTNEVLTVAAFTASDPAAAYWAGTQADGKWNTQVGGIGSGGATNWVAAATGAPDTFSLPGANTNVTFTANTATNLSTTLEQNFTINSLAFTGTATSNTAGSTIASGTGTNTLQINAAAVNGNTLGNGLSVAAGSGANLISVPVALGASQTWTSNSSNTTTVSGVVSGTGMNLTVAGAGTGGFVLSNAANTYDGITTINGSVLSVNTLANGALPSGIGQSSNVAANLVLGGGTLQYTGSSVTIDRNFTITAGTTGTIDVANASTTLELPGATGAVTTGNLAKSGLGALTLSGANTHSGNTVVNAGTLNITGSLTGLVASSALRYGDTAGNAVVNISGTVNSYRILTGANVAGSVAVMNQTAGSVTIVPPNSSDLQYLANNGGYGIYNITGGTFNTGRFDGVGAAGTAASAAVIYVGGTGTLNQNVGDWFLPIRTNGMMSMTVAPGGTFTRQAATTSQFSIIGLNGTNSYGTLNVAGGLVDTGTGGTGKGISIGGTGFSPGAGNTALVNVAGGTLILGANTSLGNAGGSTNAFFNFAGATVKATAALTTVIPASTANYVVTSTVFGPITNNNNANTAFNTQIGATSNFTGGLVVDTNNFAVGFSNALLGASGNGVTQANIGDMSLLAGNTGYIGAPLVRFAAPAGGGDPASGYAVISGGQVTGIVVTNPGVYASGETPLITLTGGGGTIAPFATTALNTANANTGGLIKKSTGTLTLSGANTFGGGVDIQGGMVMTNTLANGGSTSGIGNSSNVAANLLLNSSTATTLAASGGGILGYNGTVAGTTDRNFTLNGISGGFDASGTTLGTFTLTAANAMTVTPGLGNAVLTLQGSGAGATGAGSIGTLLADGTGTTVGVSKFGTGTWSVTNVANSYSGPTVISGGTLSVSKLSLGGVNSGIGSSGNAAGNLILKGGTLQYTGAGDTTDRNYTFGDATTAAGGGFDATGATGPLVISGNMTAVNAAAGTQVLTLTSLAASGANALNGTVVDSIPGTALTGVTKSGAGAWTMNGANAYSGLTTVNAGTLNITGTNSGVSALTFTSGGNGIVNVNSSGVVNTGTITWAGATAGVLNLNGGTLLVTGNLTSSSSTVNALSFNGGTLRVAGPTTISGSLNMNVQAGGGTIDTNGFVITSASSVSNTASPGTLNIIGGGTLSSALSATQTGPVNVTGSATKLNIVTTAGAVYPGLWTVGTGSTVDINNLGNFSFAGLAGGGTIDNTGAAAVRTVTITGTGGNNFGGAINQPTPSATAATGVTVNLTSGTQTFSGVSNYGGPTAITGGALTLTSTAGLGNTAISVSAGKSLNVLAGAGTVTAGNNATASLGATLNLAATSNFSMLDSAIGTFSLVQNAATGTAPVTMSGANLFFDITSAGVDQITSSGFTAASVFSGTNFVNLTPSGSSLTAGTYPLVTAPGIVAGTTNGFFKFSNGLSTDTISVGAFTYPLTLTSVTGIEQLTIGAGFGNLTWTGQTNGTGAANSVWIEPGAGNNNFADTTPAVADYSAGSAVTFQDLNTIAAANVTNGIVIIDAAGVNPGSVTVNNTAVNYTFSNASGSIGIAGTTPLTKTGNGILTLSSANTYSGTTEINGGILNVGNAGSLGTGTIVFGGGTLQYGTGVTTDFSNRYGTGTGNLISIDTNGNDVTNATILSSVGGTLTKSGAGTLTLTQTAAAPNTYTGATVINGGTLKITGGGASGATAGVLSGTPTITVNNGGTLLIEANFTGLSSDLIGFTANKQQLIINSGGSVLNNTVGPSTGNRQTIFNTVIMTGGTLGGNSNGDANRGAYSFNNATAAVIATSDASGNPALINTVGTGTNDGISLQNTTANIFNVTRGPAVTGLQPDLVISSPIRQYAAVAGVLTKSGNGIMTLSGANTYTGGTVIANGTVLMGPSGTLGVITGGLTFGTTANTAGNLDLQTTSQTVGSLTVVTTGATLNTNTLTLAAGKSLTVNGVTNVGNTATGSNNTVLSVNGTPTSTLTLGPTGGATTTIGSTTGNGGPGAQNAQLIVTGGTAVDIKLGTGALNIGYRNNTGTNASTVQGTSGTLDLSAAGNVSIVGSTNASTILMGSNTTGHGGTAVFDVTTGTMKLSTAGTNTVTVGTITLGHSTNTGQAGTQGYLTLGNAANNFNVDTFYVGRYKSQINGSLVSLVNFAGTGGTFTLKGFGGGATKTALRIGYNDIAATGTVTTAAMDLTGGSFNGQLSTLTIGFYNTGAGSGGGKGTLTMSAGATTLDSLVLANRGGSTSLANNTGTLNLSGGSLTFGSGGTGITSGTSAGTSGVATINLSGTGLLELANKPITLDGTGSAINMTGGTLSNFTTYSVNASTNATVAGGLIQRTIAGTTTLGNVSFTGPTAALSVTAGTVSTTGISTTDAAAMVTLDGGTLNLNGGNIGGATAVVGVFKSGTLQDVAQINNGGGLNKTTSGVLTIAGTNTYTGPTTVSAGTLVVAGSLGNTSVTVSGNATLGGTGTIGGATVVSTSGNLAPGNSPGNLTFTNGLTLNANSNFQWELTDNVTTGAGTTWDQVTVSGGALTVASTVNFVPAFSGTATAPTGTGFWASSHVWSNVFNVTGSGTITAGSATNFAIDNSAWSSFGTFSTVANGSSVDLVWNLAPTDPVLAASVTSGSATFGNVLKNGTVGNAGITITNTGGVSTGIAANTISGFTITAPSPQAVPTNGTAASTVSLNTAANGTFSGGVVYTATPGGATTTPIAVSGNVGLASYDQGPLVNSSATYGPALISQYGAVSSLPNLESTTVAGAGGLTPVTELAGSTATILKYDNTGGAAETISMAWRTRTTGEATQSNPNALLSDVVNLTGMISGSETAGTGTGLFVLQMSYSQAALDAFGVSETSIALSGELRLGWNDGGTWETAGLGNVGIGGGTATFVGVGPYNPSNPAHNVLGAYGVDTSGSGGVVWAVLNHNSEFAVIPEPSTLVLGGLALLGFAGVGLRRRRLAKQAS